MSNSEKLGEIEESGESVEAGETDAVVDTDEVGDTEIEDMMVCCSGNDLALKSANVNDADIAISN